MTYKEQLDSENWKRKRLKIVERDNRKCLKCHNQSFEDNFEKGLIIGRSVDPKIQLLESEDFSIFRLWTFQENLYLDAFMGNEIISKEKNYLCFYTVDEEKQDRAIITGFIEVPDNEIILEEDFFIKFKDNKNNLKITDECLEKLMQPVDKNTHWDIIYNLHVHHTYYQKDLLAWEYPDNSLQTLCWSCHEKLHKNETVPELDKNGKQIGKRENCKRCHGAGIFPQFKHVYMGICFRCSGSKYENV